MERVKLWARKVIFVLLVGLILPGSAEADMSEYDLRLKALEERYEAQAEKISWLDRFSFKGDFRLRHQSDYFADDNQTGSTDASNRHRQRIRLRLGGKFHVNKRVDVGFRLATGSDDPVSTNETLDDTFSTKDFRLDRAFAIYKHGPIKLTGGKFGTPFMKSELLWDSDLSMEGVSEEFTHKMGNTKAQLILGQFPIEEFGSTSDEPNLFAYQGVISHQFGNGVNAKVGLGFFDYNALAGQDDVTIGSSSLTNSLSGNTADANGNLAFNYDLIDLIGEVKFDSGIPVTLFAEWVRNTADAVQDDTGWHGGIKLGKSVKKLGDWQFKYLYRVVESDAVFAQVSDSDFHGGGTDSKGSEINLKLGLMKGAYASLSYFDTQEEKGAQNKHDILQADLIFKF